MKKRAELQTAAVYLVFWKLCQWVEKLNWSICLRAENSFPKIEDIYFESLGISEQASNAPEAVLLMFSEDILRELTKCVTNIFLSVDIIKYKHSDFTLYAQVRHLHLFQSQGNFWNRLSFVNKYLMLFEEINEKFQEN